MRYPGSGMSKLVEQALLVEPVLGVAQRSGGRVNGATLPSILLQCLDRDILKFVGNDVASRSKFASASASSKGRFGLPCRIGGGRGVGRVDEAALDIEIAGRETQHLAELAGADNTNTHELITSGRCRPGPCRSGSCGSCRVLRQWPRFHWRGWRPQAMLR